MTLLRRLGFHEVESDAERQERCNDAERRHERNRAFIADI